MRFPDIKVGDQVVINKKDAAQVERVTRTRIIVNGLPFSRIDGRHIGGSSWHPKYAELATPELMEIVTRRMEKNLSYSNANRLLNQLITFSRSIGRDETPGDIAAAIPHLEAALTAMRGDTTTPEDLK